MTKKKEWTEGRIYPHELFVVGEGLDELLDGLENLVLGQEQVAVLCQATI